MSNSGLANIDARIVSSLQRAGLADTGVYDEGLGGISCSVMVERASQLYGSLGQVISDHVTIVIALNANLKSVRTGGKVKVGTDTFVIDSIIDKDESLVTASVSQDSTC